MMNVKPIEAAEFPIQRMMTALLRWLTVAAGVVILTGGVRLLLRHAGAPTAFHTFIGEPAPYGPFRRLRWARSMAMHWQSSNSESSC
jgi:hypothetical protein